MHGVIVELRQYSLKPGQRDTLVDIFERHFIDSQQELGMKLLGQFHDLDDPDRFVWMRGFDDMVSRKAALTQFYEHSEAWKTHGPAAAATMIDVSDVLLLRPLDNGFVGAAHGQYTALITPEPVEVADPVARFEPYVAENTYPRLPVREDALFVTVLGGDGVEGLRLRPTPGSAMR